MTTDDGCLVIQEAHQALSCLGHLTKKTTEYPAYKKRKIKHDYAWKKLTKCTDNKEKKDKKVNK